MPIGDISSQPASGKSAGKNADKKSAKKGSDGIHQITQQEARKLLPLQQVLNAQQTPLSKRAIRSLMAAYQESVQTSDPAPLLEWFATHKVKEVSSGNLIPHQGMKQKGTPLKERSVQQVHTEKIAHLAMHLIRYHLSSQSSKESATSASARISPALVNRSRRKNARKTKGGSSSNFVSEQENTVLQTVERKEIDEGLDSLRENPRSLGA